MLRNFRIGTRLGIAFAPLLTAALGATVFVKVTAITGEWRSFESRTMAKLKLGRTKQADMSVVLLSIDLGKNIFQLHGVDESGRPV